MIVTHDVSLVDRMPGPRFREGQRAGACGCPSNLMLSSAGGRLESAAIIFLPRGESLGEVGAAS